MAKSPLSVFSYDNPRKNMKRLLSGRDVEGKNPEKDVRSSQAMVQAGMILKRAAVKNAPILTGHLRNSAYVRPYTSTEHGGTVVAVGFTAIYAAKVHDPVDGMLPHQRGGVSPNNVPYDPSEYSHVGVPYFLQKATVDPTVRNRMQTIVYSVAGPV